MKILSTFALALFAGWFSAGGLASTSGTVISPEQAGMVEGGFCYTVGARVGCSGTFPKNMSYEVCPARASFYFGGSYQGAKAASLHTSSDCKSPCNVQCSNWTNGAGCVPPPGYN